MLSNKILITALLCAFMAGGAPAFAEERGSPRPGGPGFSGEGPDISGQEPEGRREEIMKKVETLRKWRLIEELDMDEETAAKFLPALSSLEEKRRELDRENRETMRELRFSLDARNPDEKRLKDGLEKLEKNHQELMELRNREIQAAKDFLTVEQQARYLIFQREFQREVREIIMRARGRAPGAFGGRRGQNPPGGRSEGQGREMQPPQMGR